MKTIKKELPTGVTTQFKDKGGRISVAVKDYDTYFDQPLLETELANKSTRLLSRMYPALSHEQAAAVIYHQMALEQLRKAARSRQRRRRRWPLAVA